MMGKEFYLLLFINICSAIGYSLIAPLYPTEALKRGIKENICGFIISMFAISNFFTTPFCPGLISKYGRKNMFYFACVLEGVSTLVYGFLNLVNNYYLFLGISIIGRFAHGVGSSISATLVYSVAASLADPSQVKSTLGMMEFGWCLGVATGPMCASIFFYVGGYALPFLVVGLAIFSCIPFIYQLELPDDEEGEPPQFLKAFLDLTILSIFFTPVFDMLNKTFYFPTFTHHLITKFGMSIETSSFFYMINMISFFLLIRYLDSITNKFGLKLTLVGGLFLLFFSALFLSPIPFLPQSSFIIVIGLIIQGLGGASINVPSICDLIDTLKLKMNLDDVVANDMASAIYNLGLNFGETIGPTFGGFLTEKYDFQTSCVYTSLMTLAYCIFFAFINYENILKQLEEGKKYINENAIKPLLNVRKSLTDDTDDYNYIKPDKINSERKYVGRYRSYSYSNRSSRRSSYNKTNK